MKNKYSATFSNGHVATRTSAAVYTHVWAVIVTNTESGSTWTVTGFASDHSKASKAAGAYVARCARFNGTKGYTRVQEIVAL